MLKPRDVIAGRYRLDTPIGEGAMGAVWRAEDQTLKRQIAIKFLFVRGARDPQAMVDQFLREARIAASVQHRNVIHTVDFGTVDDFQPFMVMELLNGESLGDRMARQPPLSNEQLIHIMSLTLRGLSAVHDAGIVHRDLKPQNIFLQRDADAVYPKILDFGISRSLNGGEDRPSAIQTQEGMIVGTPDYMSPEQARGERTIDRRADIYSMGAILFEGLTGRLPFIADTIGDLIVQIVTTEPPRAIDISPSVPKPLSDLVSQAMSRNKEHRFADARALRRALLAAAEAAWSHGGRIAASVPPPPVQTGQGAGLLSLPPPAPRRAAAEQAAAPNAAAGGWGAPPSQKGGGTWGDFEGLESPRIRDDNPPPPDAPPSIAPPKQQRLVARANDPALDLPATPMDDPLFADDPKPSALAPLDLDAVPARSRTQAKKPERANSAAVPPPRANSGAVPPPRASKPRAKADAAHDDNSDGLDPLYSGRDRAAPEVDYDRMRAATMAAAPAQQAQATAQAHVQARKRVASKAAQQVSARKHRRSGSRFGGLYWLVPILALSAVAYVLYMPGRMPAPGAAQIAPGEDRSTSATPLDADTSTLRGRSRREHPGDAPAHLRDVVF